MRAFRVGNSEFGIGNSDDACHSAFRIPHSAISLTEVLISLGVITFGLLGVAALFPVGGHYMRTGEVNDRAAAIAQQAFSDLLARGMLNPDNWLTHAELISGDGPFGRPHREAIADVMNRNFSNEAARQRKLNSIFGSTFVIDPLSIGRVNEIAPPGPAPAATVDFYHGAVRLFPFAAPSRAEALAEDRPSWDPWRAGNNLSTNVPFPVKRITLAMPNPNPSSGSRTIVPLNRDVAEAIFIVDDDLRTEVYAAGVPLVQYWEDHTDNGIVAPLRREGRGDFSWLATIAPSRSDARDTLGEKDNGFAAEVSVVVFYKRLFDPAANTEMLARARVLSTSPSGGELVL